MQAERRMTRSIAAAAFKEEKKKSALLTHEELDEVLKEPVPDLYPIMKAYSEKYFEGSVKGFVIRWTSQLRKCASRTIYSPLREIIMSKPLLVGLKKKIMIESLLHEMVHVSLFFYYEPHYRHHGEEFVNIMTRINNEAGLNVTISKEGSLQNIARLQIVWECNKCKERLTRLNKGKIYCSNSFRARNHARACNGEWQLVQ